MNQTISHLKIYRYIQIIKNDKQVYKENKKKINMKYF